MTATSALTEASADLRNTEGGVLGAGPPPRRASGARFGAVFREAARAAIAAPVASILTIVMIAGMCAAVLLTSGRTVGAEQAVIGSIDSVGTRSIIVRAEPGAGVDTTALDRIDNLEGIEWAAGFGPAADVRNSSFPGGTRVPLRLAYGDSWEVFGIPDNVPGDGDVAYASPTALEQLGMTEPFGGVNASNGPGYAVSGQASVPEHLRFLEPMLIAPQRPGGAASPVSTLVIIAERPDLVAPIAAAVESVLAAADKTRVSVQTSEDLAALRAIVEGHLGTFGRGLTLGILALTALLAAAILYGIVMLRRKDYGRRRALGASQQLIVALLLIQTGLLAGLGALIGTVTATLVLAAVGDPLPSALYCVGVGVLAVAVGLIASLVPALVAARREPITELRVP